MTAARRAARAILRARSGSTTPSGSVVSASHTSCELTSVFAAPISSAREAVGGGFDNPSSWELNLRFYAVTYGVAVVMANRIGTEGMLGFWGGSRILDPFGNTVAKGSMTDEELVVGELDYASLREARFLLPTVRDARVFAGRRIRAPQQRNKT